MVSWPFEWPCSLIYTCNVAFSRKEVTWILKSTKSLNGGKSSPLDSSQRVISCVKSTSSLMIYGNTWFWNHSRKRNVSWFLPRSLPIYLGSLSKLQGGFHEWNFRIRALDRRRGTYLITTNVIFYANMIIGPWQWFTGPECTHQGCNRPAEELQAHFGSPSSHKHWLWDIYRIREGHQRSDWRRNKGNWTLSNMHTYCLTWNRCIL